MTQPIGQGALANTSDTASSALELPDESAVVAVPGPGDVYVIRAELGQRHTIVAQYDLSHAKAEGNPVVPIWTDPALVIAAYALNAVVDTSTKILREVFGPTAFLRPDIEKDPDSSAPTLLFYLNVPREARHLRGNYVARFVRENSIPDGAPIPTLMWEYHAVSS